MSQKLNPQLWGGAYWIVMHVIADGYDPTDEKDKLIRRAFFENLTRLLPCPECRAHYDTLLKTNPVGMNMTTRNTLVAWVEWVQGEVEKKIFANKQQQPQDDPAQPTLDTDSAKVDEHQDAKGPPVAPLDVSYLASDQAPPTPHVVTSTTPNGLPQFQSAPRAMTAKERYELCLKKFVRPASCGCR